ncbi:MAG: hypothetical protein IT581_14060 [Verrucomicrobiales bacterium]|nr:hypothetical protein [Verrucomicrobiales bacterium]
MKKTAIIIGTVITFFVVAVWVSAQGTIGYPVTADPVTRVLTSPTNFFDKNSNKIASALNITQYAQRSLFDANLDGVVDNSAALGGQGIGYFLNRSNQSGTISRSVISDFAHGSLHGPGGTDALPWTSIHGIGATTNRPAASSTNAGFIYLNTTTGGLQRSDGTNWVDFLISSGSGVNTNGAGEDYIVIFKNGALRTTNAPTFGSITVTGDMTINGNLVIGTAIPTSALAPEILTETEANDLFQPLNARLSQLATLSGVPGDIFYLNSSTQLVRLPIGTDGQFLKVSSSFPAWVTSSGSGTNDFQPLSARLTQLADLTGSPGDIFYLNASNVLVRLPIGTNGQLLQVASTAPAWITPTNVTSANNFQPLSTRLTQIADLAGAPGDIFYFNGSTQFVKLPAGSEGQFLKFVSGYPAWVTDSAGTFAYDIDFRFSITNTDTTLIPIYTNTIPDGQTKRFEINIVQSGATNGGGASYTLVTRASNRGGTLMVTNAVVAPLYSDTNVTGFFTNSGSNVVLMVRGPVYQPQNGLAQGRIGVVTNAGTFAGGGGGSALTNGVVAHWEMSQTGSTSEPDVMGDNDLTVSAGDTIPTRNNGVLFGRDFVDGEDDHLTIADNDEISFSPTGSFTLLAWVNFDSVGVTRPIINKSNEVSLLLQNTDSTIRWTVANATTNKQVTGPVAVAGTNYLLAASYNYTNGLVELLVISALGTNSYSASFTNGSQNGTSGFFIGTSASSTALNMDGIIDEVTVIKRYVPTNDIITKLWNGGSPVAWPWTGL